MSTSRLLLETHGLSKHFPGVRALHDITFDVRAGEVHGLVGENGAGKSTLMGVASGALVATEGRVRIDGEAMEGDPDLARELGLAIVRSIAERHGARLVLDTSALGGLRIAVGFPPAPAAH